MDRGNEKHRLPNFSQSPMSAKGQTVRHGNGPKSRFRAAEGIVATVDCFLILCEIRVICGWFSASWNGLAILPRSRFGLVCCCI